MIRSCLVITVILPAVAVGGETLDRIAATVDKEVITESALVMDLKIAAFLDRKPVDVTGVAKRRSAERLVDRILILREANESRLPLPTAAQAAELVDQIRASYASEDEFNAELERHDLTERDLLAHMLDGLQASVFTDLRFRPGVYVSEEDLQAYYVQLTAGLGSTVRSFDASRDEIRRVLTEQRVIQALDAWLVTVRASIRISFRERVFQ